VLPSRRIERPALRQKLAENPRAPGAERQAHRHFLLPRGGSSEHQPGDVGASNQQNDSDGEHQEIQRIRVAGSVAGEAGLRGYQAQLRIVGGG
jgi:hypothetical protein